MPVLSKDSALRIATQVRSSIVILVRHGQSVYNLEHLLTGWHNPPLTPKGQIQADLVGRQLMSCPLDAIVSSDLARAQETARRIGRYHPKVEIQLHEGFREICHGQFEGKSMDQLYRMDPWQSWLWETRPAEAVKPGGELLAQAYHRVSSAFDTTRAEVLDNCVTPCPVILVVSHEGPMRMMLCHALGMDVEEHFWEFKLPNCGILTLEFCGKDHANLLGAVPKF
jgi:phosphoserine phosphatase